MWALSLSYREKLKLREAVTQRNQSQPAGNLHLVFKARLPALWQLSFGMGKKTLDCLYAMELAFHKGGESQGQTSSRAGQETVELMLAPDLRSYRDCRSQSRW